MAVHPTLLSRAQVLERLGGRSTSWLYQEMAEGRVPRPIRLGLSAVAWVESEISDYIARHIAENRVTLYAKPRKRPAKNSGSVMTPCDFFHRPTGTAPDDHFAALISEGTGES